MQGLFLLFTAGSFIAACFYGKMDALSTAALKGCTDGVTLCLTLLGSMGFWSGILKIAEDSALTQKLTHLLQPLIHRLFHPIKDEETLSCISMNIAANLLGLGNAATPFGIRAIRRLDTLNQHAETPSLQMILLTAINASSLQLIPTTVGFLRSQYGSTAPFSILPATLLTSLCALCFAVAAVYALCHKSKSV